MATDRPRTVLLVEDHAAEAGWIRELLRDQSVLQLTWVETLGAALAHLREAGVDLVLLDLGLPDSRGVDTVVRVVREHPTLPVIVLTSHADETLARAALAAGAEDYIVKGAIEPAALVRAIEYAYERKQTELALREAHELTTQIVLSVQEGIVVYDRELCQQVWNPFMERMTGVPAAAVVGRHILEASPFSGEPGVAAALQRALAGEVVTMPEIPYRAPVDGSEGWTMASFAPLRDAQGVIIGVIGNVRDITLRKQAEALLRSLSAVDELTGLQNRRGFLTLAPQCLKLAERQRKGALLLFADLDGLKAINDTKGRLAGDQALRDVAALLKRTFRASDILARVGADEFSILALEAPMTSKDKLLARLHQNLQEHNAATARPLSLSLGVARYDWRHPCSVDELLAHADAAMHDEKRAKKKQQVLTD